MAFDTTTGAAYAVLFSVLSLFTLIAIASAGYLRSCLPNGLNNQFALRPSGQDTEEVEKEHGSHNNGADFYLSARNSAPATMIALSFFASGMGAWVLYGPTELGATPSLSWLAVIGYACASSAPAIVVYFFGPIVRERCQEKSFSITDYGHQRYGRVMQVVIALLSIFYMFIYLVAELTAISNVFGLICGMDTTSQSSVRYTTGIAISVGAFTLFYTSVAGLPSSIVTDKFQGIMMVILVLLLTFAVSLNPANNITKE